MNRSFASVLLAAGLLVVSGLAASPAVAGETNDLLFRDRQLAPLAEGTSLHYEHLREGGKDSELHPIEDGTIELSIEAAADGSREALVRMRDGGKRRELDPFPGSAGNPLIMVFLESSLRSMAQVTGGSPFYIRNRIKEALRVGGAMQEVEAVLEGERVLAREIRLLPFAEDPNRPRMGAFADLEMRFLVSEAVPGDYLLFSASTPPDEDGAVAYREEILLTSVEED